MDFFKPGSTLKREDPKAHTYEHTRARDAYRKQLEIFKIRFEAELTKHPKLDLDAKQEVRIRAKRLREICLANYREGLQGLATTNHRRNYKDLFLGTRDISFEMHDTTILDYELRLASEIDTIISNLKLMAEDKSNRDTLDWMAKLAKQKFAYELFECDNHPHEPEINLELESVEQPKHPFNQEEELTGPIYQSQRRQKSSVNSVNNHLDGYSNCEDSKDYNDDGSIMNGEQSNLQPFTREFNYIKSNKVLNECEHDAEENEIEFLPKRPLVLDEQIKRDTTLSPSRESFLDMAYYDYINKDRDRDQIRENRPFNIEKPIYRRGRAPKPPVDIDNEDDVEEFLARSRALLRKSARPTHFRGYDDEDEEEEEITN